jgi:plastocyanin
VRSPFGSEQEAFRFVLQVLLVLIAIVLAATLGPTWLAVAVPAVLLCALAARATQLRMRKLRGLVSPIKMAPPHVGGPNERRILIVANDTLGEESLLGEVERLGSKPGTHVLLLAPAVISAGARLSGAVDGPLDQARTRMTAALQRIGNERVLGGEITDANPLDAIEDAFTMFTPDEVIVSTGWEPSADGLEPQLAGLARERFAVPVRHLVFDSGAGAREPSLDVEARYRRESGETAARQFGFRALAGAGILAAVLMSAGALIHSTERSEARTASKAVAEQIAGLPAVAKAVTLSVIPEYKPGPEGEKHDAFTTTEFAIRAGQPQTLKIDNTDSVPHSITAPGAHLNIVLMPGTHTYTLAIKQPGRYLWFCTYVCDEWAMEHPGYMSGYITVS